MRSPKHASDATPSTLPAAWADTALARRLVAWQRVHGRHDLPWQGTRDPYRVWLSEVMLQQTQVATVIGYYERFLQRFPQVQHLARAELDEVLAMWSGLGYYARARLMHRCAQRVMSDHAGQFPRRSEELAQLPGIGPSTAAAIAVFCFGERAAILDGNVKRVLSRALGFGGDLAQPAQERALWSLARQLLPARDVRAYTQGLMDLGSQVCTPRRPNCAACPLAEGCEATRRGDPHAYPVRKRRLQRGHRCSSLLWLTHGTRVWLEHRPPRGVWSGLWSLPERAAEELQALSAHWPGRGEELPAIEHALTHFDWQLRPLRWQLPARLSQERVQRLQAVLGAGRWWQWDEALRLGLPAPVRRLLSGG